MVLEFVWEGDDKLVGFFDLLAVTGITIEVSHKNVKFFF